MKKLAGLALTLAIVFAFTACESATEIENEALLKDGVWTFDDLTTESDDEAVITLVTAAKAAFTDATMELRDDGSYLQYITLTQDSIEGSWSLVLETRFILTPEGKLPLTSTIETLTANSLVYKEDKSYLDYDYNLTTSWVRE